jgi:membrane-associated phospholipid phosphatase
MLLNVVLKNVFQRARPTFDHLLLTFSGHNFPSGHTMAAAMLYGTLAALALARIRAWHWRVLVVVVATFLIMLVSFSRIYLGAHYLSDVLGAMVEGLAWLAFCLTAVNAVRRQAILTTEPA